MQQDLTIDTTGLTYEDIKPGVRHYVSHVVSQVQNPNGSWRKIYAGEDHFKTKIGLLPLHEWAPIARQQATGSCSTRSSSTSRATAGTSKHGEALRPTPWSAWSTVHTKHGRSAVSLHRQHIRHSRRCSGRSRKWR